MTWSGFLASPEVRTALAVGGLAALVSAVVGVFTVIRGQSFAGHALTDASATGGAGLALIGVNPFVGFLAGAVAGGGAMEAAGHPGGSAAAPTIGARSRDLATGNILGASMGMAALFLYLATTTSAASNAPQQVLFGSLFATPSSTLPLVAGFGALCLVIVAAIHRPLLLSTLSADLAAVRGVPVRMVGLVHTVTLAVAVALSSVAVGAILSTALLVGPAAASLRLTRRLPAAVAVSAALAVGATWIGVVLAYDSAGWFADGRGLPVSFFIVAVVLALYVAARLATRRAA